MIHLCSMQENFESKQSEGSEAGEVSQQVWAKQAEAGGPVQADRIA